VTSAERRRSVVFGALVLGVTATALLIHAGPSPRRPPDRHERSAPSVVGGRQAPQQTAPRPLRRRDALAVARRFAAAYAAWDAGRRGPRVARRLAAITTPALFDFLREAGARPTARPARALPLQPAGAFGGPDDGYRVPLTLERSPGAHVATLVVIATPAGARVAQLER
jgi:hypothetical protein